MLGHAGVRCTSMTAAATASAPSATNTPISITWNVQKRSFGW